MTPWSWSGPWAGRSSAVARELGCGESIHAAPFLSAWIDLRGTAPGPLVCAIDRAGNLRAGRPLTGEAVRHLLQRRATVAGLASVAPHDLRRSYAGDLLDAGVRPSRGATAAGPCLAGHDVSV